MADFATQQVLTAVNRLHKRVDGLGSAVNVLDVHVNAVGVEAAAARNELAALRQDFNRYIRQAELQANVQRSEIKKGALQNEVEHTFGHYKVVRRTAVGILQQFDVGLVSEETVRNVGEQLMIQTPRYWLAPVLVALSAWAGDDRELCTRAVEEAFRRSPQKASLFLALVLRRQGRSEAATRWLRHYLEGLDPRALGRDFAVILEAISQGAFGPAGVELVAKVSERWRALLIEDDAAREAQVARWERECEKYQVVVTDSTFPRLAEVSPQWPQLRRSLAAVGAHQGIHDSYSRLMSEEIPTQLRLEDAVDDILDRLVSEFDNEELPLRRELAYHQAVLDAEGDLERAKAVAEGESATFDETLDFLTIQTTSALNPEQIGVSRSTQRMAVATCHGWFAEAHERYTARCRAARPADVEVRLDHRVTVQSRSFELTWSGSLRKDVAHLEKNLARQWDRETAAFLEQLRFDWSKQAIACAGVCLLILLFGAGAIGVALVFALVVGVVWGIGIFSQVSGSNVKRERVQRQLAGEKKDSIAQLRGAAAELVDWDTRFRTDLAVSERTGELIRSMPAAGVGGRFEGRVVGSPSTPQDTAAQDTAPQDTAPQDTAPQDTAPRELAARHEGE